MEMHQVRYFLAVADELNFTRAAEKCNVSQPSLSRAIKMLEFEFGGDLFRREHSHTHLSDLGQMIRPHLEILHQAAANAKLVSNDLTQMKKVPPLKLGIMSTISPDEIVDLIAPLETQHKGLELRLCDASARELHDRLLDGDLEVVIYALPGKKFDDRTHVMPLFYIHRVNCEFAGYADHILKEKGVTCTPSYWSERDDWTLAMVAAGLGFAFMPKNAIKHPDVIGVPIVDPEFWREVNLVTVRGRPYSPGVGALVREAMRKKWFGQHAIAARSVEEKYRHG